MNNLRKQFEQFRKEVEAARAAQANYDRPNSLFSAGNVGTREPASRNQVPSSQSAEYGPSGRRLSGERRDDSPQRGCTTDGVLPDLGSSRTRPTAVPVNSSVRPNRMAVGTTSQPQSRRADILRARLKSPKGLRMAIVLHEVLGPPVALRENDER